MANGDSTDDASGIQVAAQATEDAIDSLTPDNDNPQLTKTFQRMRSDLSRYGYAAIESGPSIDYKTKTPKHTPIGTTNTPEVPFMVSAVPPRVFPSGETRTAQIKAPQTADVKLTKIGDDTPPNITTQAVGDGAFEETEVSVANVESGDPFGNTSYEEYLSNLTDRYRSFQRSARQADADLEEKSRQEVVGRPEVKDPLQDTGGAVAEARTPSQVESQLRRQVIEMANLPPLFMYVAPSEWSVSYERIVSDGNRTRYGYTVEDWGLEQPTVSASGNVGAFYIHSTDSLGRPAGGLTDELRKESAAYKEFMKLFMLYQNNGYIFNDDQRISLVGSVRIFYDDTIYTGSFDDFSISEAEDQPFTLEYDFSFTVRFLEHVDL